MSWNCISYTTLTRLEIKSRWVEVDVVESRKINEVEQSSVRDIEGQSVQMYQLFSFQVIATYICLFVCVLTR